MGIYNDFNVLQFLLDDEYRAIAIDAYDLIKGTINILDIISRVPHFQAMIDSSSVDFYLFSSISSVFNLMYNSFITDIFPFILRKILKLYHSS